jgi:surfactin synthase thioesterase subunit
VEYENFAVLKDVKNSRKMLVLVPYAGGDATAYAKFVDLMAKKKPDMSICYVDYLHSVEDCKKVADIIAEESKNKELCIYSHCAGAAVALQIINILEENGINVSRYITGGYIPPKKAPKKNGWNTVSDKNIKKKLISAGAPLDSFTDSQTKDMLDKFRKDTDFMTWYHYNNAKAISTVTDSIISKTDVFTNNYKDAEKLWRGSAVNFNDVHFIETDSHYFQSDNCDVLVEMIINILG